MTAAELLASIATPSFVIALAWLLTGRQPQPSLAPARIRRRD